MISLLVPTRGRPLNVARMAESARATASSEIEFIFRVDDDDPDAMPARMDYSDTTVLIGSRTTLSQLWNECQLAATADIFMQCDDEVIFRSDGWDQKVMSAFADYPDRIAFVHGQDLHQPAGTFGALGFLHRRWVDTVGYFPPPYFSCDYGDTWLNDVANAIGRRRYLPDVITEHMHPIAGKGVWDVTHTERLMRGTADDTPGLYASLAGKRAEDADKLRTVMGTPIWKIEKRS